VRVGLFCACGAGLEGEILPDSAAQVAIDAFRQVHSAPGCRGVDRETALHVAREVAGRP
jgi:hypothetical protein